MIRLSFHEVNGHVRGLYIFEKFTIFRTVGVQAHVSEEAHAGFQDNQVQPWASNLLPKWKKGFLVPL